MLVNWLKKTDNTYRVRWKYQGVESLLRERLCCNRQSGLCRMRPCPIAYILYGTLEVNKPLSLDRCNCCELW